MLPFIVDGVLLQNATPIARHQTVVTVDLKSFLLAQQIALLVPQVNQILQHPFQQSDLTPSHLSQLMNEEKNAVLNKDNLHFKVTSANAMSEERFDKVKDVVNTDLYTINIMDAKEELGEFFNLVKAIVSDLDYDKDECELHDKTFKTNPQLAVVYNVMVNLIKVKGIIEWTNDTFTLFIKTTNE